MADAKLFTNVMIFDGTGGTSFLGEVLVEGNRVKKVAQGINQIDRGGEQLEVVDGAGGRSCRGWSKATDTSLLQTYVIFVPWAGRLPKSICCGRCIMRTRC